MKGRVYPPQRPTTGLGSDSPGKRLGAQVSSTPVIPFQPLLLGIGLDRRRDRRSPGVLPAQWILELLARPPTMSFEGVVVVTVGTESPRPSEGYSVGAVSLLFSLFLILLQLFSGLDHRQAASSVALGHQVSTCEEHLWDVLVHGRYTQASLNQEDREW